MIYTYRNNGSEKNVRDTLRQNAEIPAVVHDRINKAYRIIENRQTIQKPVPGNTFRWMKTGGKIAGGLAAVLCLGFVLCVTNPVMARELPLVGSLFEKLQDDVSFFGNFADKAAALEDPASAESAEADVSESTAIGESPSEASDAANASESSSDRPYSKTSDGLTVSFSEIYANDQAIYLTMTAEAEDKFPETLNGQDGKPIISMIASTEFDFKENSDPAENIQYYNLEGTFLDERTYSCILRIDLAEAARDYTEYQEQHERMVQEVLDEMGISQEDLTDETEEGYELLNQFVDEVSARGGALESYIKTVKIPDSFRLSLHITELQGDRPADESSAISEENPDSAFSQYTFKGNWDFEIPVSIDTSQTVTLDINETNENGIGLKSVVKTPYELTVYELYEEGSDSDCFLVALDANGNKLPYNESNGNTNNFTVQDRDISTVDIYILDYTQYMDELKGEEWYSGNENRPEGEKWSDLLDQYAKYHKTVHFDQ